MEDEDDTGPRTTDANNIYRKVLKCRGNSFKYTFIPSEDLYQRYRLQSIDSEAADFHATP